MALQGRYSLQEQGVGQDPLADCMLLQMEGWMDRRSTAQCHKH